MAQKGERVLNELGRGLRVFLKNCQSGGELGTKLREGGIGRH